MQSTKDDSCHRYSSAARYKKQTCSVCGLIYSRPPAKPKGLARRGRPRMGKTHKRSQAAKTRRNLRSRRNSRYRFTGTHLVHNIMEFGSPKNWEGRIAYHRNRYAKAGRPWTEPRQPPCGFRLLNSKHYDLPQIVVDAVTRIYSGNPVITYRAKGPKSNVSSRTPRNRSQSDVIKSLEVFLEENSMRIPLERWNALNASLEEEILMRKRRSLYTEHNGNYTRVCIEYEKWILERYGSHTPSGNFNITKRHL